MTIFDEVKRKAQEENIERTKQYESLRKQRMDELQSLALEADLMLDGRRNRKRKKFQGDK